VPASSEGKVPIRNDDDIVEVRQLVRDVTRDMGFGLTDVTRVVTAASELARNVVTHAGSGCMHWRRVQRPGSEGVELTIEDHGPGIADVDQALQEGYSTGGGLGMGLSGARRLMDELEIHSKLGEGTTIVGRKWLKDA